MIKIKKLSSILLIFSIILIFFVGSRTKQKEFSNSIESKSIIDNTEKNCIPINVTIFVHGTHTQPLTKIFKKFIYGPNKLEKINALDHYCYLHACMKKISEIDPNTFPIDSFYAFGWSGKLSSKARTIDAEKLYQEIKSLNESYKTKGLLPKFTIITHSHGGNVALNLANFAQNEAHNGLKAVVSSEIPPKLTQPSHKATAGFLSLSSPVLKNMGFSATANKENDFIIEKLVLLACPVQRETQDFTKNKIFKNIYNIYSTMDMLQVLDPQGIKLRNKGKNYPIFSQRKFPCNENLKQSKIKINGRSLFHVEFILPRFLQHLPNLIKEMDKIDSKKINNLIKIEKNGSMKLIK